MPYTENLSLERVFLAAEVGNSYSYATVTLAQTLAASAQLQLRWELTTVTDSLGNPVATSSLAASERAQIFILDESYYTVNTGALTVTVDDVLLSQSDVTVTDSQGQVEVYTRPDFTVINATNPFKIRRSIDVSNAVVDFQSGGRLTAAQLNAAIEQLLYSTQELSEYGSGGSAESDVDLSGESINALGDVNLNSGNTGALLVIGPNGVITDSTTGGTNAVLSVNGATGAVVLDYIDVGAAASGHTHTYADITDLSSMSVNELGDVDTTTLTPTIGDTLVWNGTNWAPHDKVAYGTGTGLPPASWINDTDRQAGDIYVRTG